MDSQINEKRNRIGKGKTLILKPAARPERKPSPDEKAEEMKRVRDASLQ